VKCVEDCKTIRLLLILVKICAKVTTKYGKTVAIVLPLREKILVESKL
jgi:hypothetical protein